MTTKRGLRELEKCLKHVRDLRRHELLSRSRAAGDGADEQARDRRLASYASTEVEIIDLIGRVHSFREDKARILAVRGYVTMDVVMAAIQSAVQDVVPERRAAAAAKVKWQDAPSPAARRQMRASWAMARAQYVYGQAFLDQVVKVGSLARLTPPEGAKEAPADAS